MLEDLLLQCKPVVILHGVSLLQRAGKVVNMLATEDQAVACVASHPHAPILASGAGATGSTVRLWAPEVRRSTRCVRMCRQWRQLHCKIWFRIGWMASFTLHTLVFGAFALLGQTLRAAVVPAASSKCRLPAS